MAKKRSQHTGTMYHSVGQNPKPETKTFQAAEKSVFRPGHVEIRSVEYTDQDGRTLRLTVETEYHPKPSPVPWANNVVHLAHLADEWQERLAKQLLEKGRVDIAGDLPLIRQLKFSGGK
jgi:hypothetical protein